MTSNGRIYLDYHATTPVDPRVVEVVTHYMAEEFGNANSSDHLFGDVAESAVEKAREYVAQLIGAEARQVIFTSGATESISIALRGFVSRLRSLGVKRPIRIATSRMEHKAVLRTCEDLATNAGVVLDFLSVDSTGRVDLGELERLCDKGQDLVCLMTANNEVGNIYPVFQASRIVQQSGAFFFSDGTQAVGKIPVDFTEWQLDGLALSAHKFYGPKGVGALVLSERFPISTAAGTEHLRPGTPNVPGIAGLGKAAHLRHLEMSGDSRRVAQLRDELQTLLSQQISPLVVNGDVEARLPGNLHVSIPGVPNQALLGRIRHQIALSTGAACSSGIEASHVLQAMNLSPALANSALRFGLGKFSTVDEVDRVAEILTQEIAHIQKLT